MVLVDNSIAIINIAKQRLQQNGKRFPGSIKFLYANVLDITLTKKFDHVFSFGMMHLFEDKERFLNSTLGTLKPNGTF